MVEMGATGTQITFAQLHAEVQRVAAGLAELGVSHGDRVALLIPPGIDLAACVFACWRIGAVVVIADAGLGVRGMSRALTSAAPAYLIGIPRALAAAAALALARDPHFHRCDGSGRGPPAGCAGDAR